jgi:hypothetical protein
MHTPPGSSLCSLAEELMKRPLSYFMRSSQPHAANSITILGERQQLAPLSDALWQAANHSLAELDVAHLNRAMLLNAPSDHWHGLGKLGPEAARCHSPISPSPSRSSVRLPRLAVEPRKTSFS